MTIEDLLITSLTLFCCAISFGIGYLRGRNTPRARREKALRSYFQRLYRHE